VSHFRGEVGQGGRVTPECSEQEALASFWLLAGLTLWGRWREVRKGLLLLLVLPGTLPLYFLNAARIYGLVVVGTCWSPRACVSLAHSRIGGMLFLGITAALLSLTLRPGGTQAAVAN
jgi:exosortase/archaeosortase family protein